MKKGVRLGRPPIKTGSVPKALATSRDGVQILQARKIWLDELELHNSKLESLNSLNEKEISMKTWVGCTSADYETYPEKYKRLNTLVIRKIRELDTGKKSKILRLYDPQTGITKICGASRGQARGVQKRKLAIAGGHLASAVEDDEVFTLGTNIGGELIGHLDTKIKNSGLLTDESKRTAFTEVVKTAVAAGVQIARDDITQDILGALSNSPRLIAVDEKNNDTYSTNMKKLRKKGSPAIKEVKVVDVTKGDEK